LATTTQTALSSKRKFTFNSFWNSAQEQILGYLFILPAILLVCLFGLFPIGYSFYMSLRRWRVIDRGYIGFGNYAKALGDDWIGIVLFIVGFLLLLVAYYIWDSSWLSKDDDPLNSKREGSTIIATVVTFVIGLVAIAQGWGRMFEAGDDDYLASLPITFYYAIGAVPIQLALALVLAYILFQKLRGQELFRMFFFLPYVTPVIATALVFRFIFSPRQTSLANQLLERIGLSPQQWLFESEKLINLIFGTNLDGFFSGPSMALWSITLFGIWTFVGYNTIIFLAGLGNIPTSVYEAAEIDGANHFELFRYITVPLLSPVTFYLSLIGFIGTFKAFNHIFVMQTPSAQGTVETASVAIFNTFYKASQFGYATAQAMILFAIIMFLTFVQTKVFGEKVFYG